LQAIAAHSEGFAALAEGNLDARVEHCPGWTVADLASHLTEVQWFWATIAEEKLSSPPDDSRRPSPAPQDRLIEALRTGAHRLVSVLRSSNWQDAVWTWAPLQQDIAFIARHQVQEAAVHHWDAAHAAGRNLVIETPVALDAIDEFLTFSVSSDADPADPVRPALAGRFALGATDAGARWSISDGVAPGTVRFEHDGQPAVPTILASASDLLLWLYRRVELDSTPTASELFVRFRGLCFTA